MTGAGDARVVRCEYNGQPHPIDEECVNVVDALPPLHAAGDGPPPSPALVIDVMPAPVLTDEQRRAHEARRTIRQFWNWANLCGCGNPEIVLEVLRQALEAHLEPSGPRPAAGLLPDEPAWLFVRYTLDAWDLTEHGGSVYGAWLTPDGIRLRDALRLVDPATALDDDWWEVDELVSGGGTLSAGEWRPEASGDG